MMARIRLLFVRALDLPFHTLFLKALARGRVEIRAFLSNLNSHLVSTRTPPPRYEDQRPTRLMLTSPPAATIESDAPNLTIANDHALRHEFDLLGSGWAHVQRGMTCRGAEGNIYAATGVIDSVTKSSDVTWLKRQTRFLNRKLSVDTWALIANTDYQPIDWHLDFKSGYRWNPRTWWRNIPYGYLPGVDIKVPWELARMQHLTGFAFEAEKVKSSNPERATKLVGETRSQILDFIAQNPPLFGVNWRCAMDVGIRAANWVLVVDLFRASGFEFDQPFYQALLASLEDHGKFIENNFEKYPDFRANHYLANICGLAFIAAALPGDSPLKSRWLEISRRELVQEIEYQFLPDGSNFEASTAYHRLSGEMVTFTSALLQGESVQFQTAFEIPNMLRRDLLNIGLFAEAVTKPSGEIVQVGDCDSGRFFKTPARFEQKEGRFTENDLDVRDLPEATRALFGQPTNSITGSIVKALAHAPLPLPAGETTDREIHEHLLPFLPKTALEEAFLKARFRRDYFFSLPGLTPDPQILSFDAFGLTIFKNADFFLSFRCGPLGQYGRAGHDHDDQLSVELEAGGRRIVADPGTYLYTALPRRRNEYRSISAHHAPQFKTGECADLDAGLFYLRRVKPGKVVGRGPRYVAGTCERGPGSVYRMITIEAGGVRIRDWSNAGELVDLNDLRPPPFSPGYGRIE